MSAALALTPPQNPRFDDVYPRIEKVVQRVVYRRLAADEDRDDVIQDTFLEVFRAMGSLRDPARLDVWAARIAINMVNTHLRRRPKGHVSRDADPSVDVPEVVDWDSKLLASSALGLVLKLPRGERDVFCRAAFAPGRWRQIAEDAHCSIATVKRRMRRARSRFERLARADPSLARLL